MISVIKFLLLRFALLPKVVFQVDEFIKIIESYLFGSGYFAVDGNLPSETILP